MKIISKLFMFLFFICSITGCACNYWQLTTQNQPVNKQWTMSVCADWIHEGSTITEQSIEEAMRNANRLLKASVHSELHVCHVIPGSIRFFRGAYIVMQVDCDQPLRGVEWQRGSTPKQYIIKLNKEKKE